MGFHSIVKVNETERLNAPVRAVFKASLAAPYSHQSTNGSFDFVIGLRTIDAGKFLTDAVLPTSFAESMIVSPFKFRDLTWALMIRSLIIKAHVLQARNKIFFL